MRRLILGWIALLVFASIPHVSAGTIPEDGKVLDFRTIIQNAKEKVFPAVVFLMPISERYEGGKREKMQVSGSGVIISESGEAVTNWHVVDKAVTIRCLLLDGTVGEAEVIGSDKDTDLALIQIKIDGRKTFPFAELGDSDALTEGQFVMAMGAPWGLSRSVSLGILSCTTRFMPEGQYNLWLQTDASINPGNSGGPLVNTNGVVIGINTLGTFFGGDMAFSIPSNVVKKIVKDLREHGSVPRAWTGLRLQPLKDFEKNMFFQAESGVLIASIDAGSPAEKSGLEIGDLLIAIGDTPVSGVNREDIPLVSQTLAELSVEKPVEVHVKRGDKELALSMTPRRKGEVEGEDFDCKQWNMTVKTINEFNNPGLYFFQKKGVFVQGVKYPGNAASSGVGRGDILVEIDGTTIESLEKFKEIYQRIIADEDREKKVPFVVLRSGLRHYLVMDYATEYEQD